MRFSNHKHAPGLFRDKVVDKPEVKASGVYILVLAKGFVKVGSAKILRRGVRTEIDEKMNQKSEYMQGARLFVVENGEWTKPERIKLRNKWIKLLRDKAPHGRVLNRPKKPVYVPIPVPGTTKLYTLKSPSGFQYPVLEADLARILKLKAEALQARISISTWHVAGLSNFAVATAPTGRPKALQRDPKFKQLLNPKPKPKKA